MTSGRDSSRLRRVRVELADGFNFVGTVVDESYDRGTRTLLVEDSVGQQRAVRPAQPHVSVDDLEDGAGRDGRDDGGSPQ